MDKTFIVTIDGPCAAGKTSTATLVAKKLNAQYPNTMYLDTGAIYRALAYALLANNQNIDDEENITAHARQIFNSDISIQQNNGRMQLWFKRENITEKIRTNVISDIASRVSVYPGIREIVNEQIHKLANGHNIVAEGRDTGTHLFPNADVKIYLTAKEKTRADRRMAQTPDQFEDLDEALRDITTRDERDMSRTTAPLPRRNEVSKYKLIPVDNTQMGYYETVLTILNIVDTIFKMIRNNLL